MPSELDRLRMERKAQKRDAKVLWGTPLEHETKGGKRSSELKGGKPCSESQRLRANARRPNH